MAQFGGVFYDRLRRVSQAVANGHDRFESAGRTYEQFRDYCRKSHSFINIDTNNLEELFCAAEAIREARIPTLALAQGPTPIVEIISDLKLWTWNIYQGLPDYFERANRGAVSDRYRAFMEWLKPLHGTTTVLTTNYDALFETIAYKADVRVRHPFESEPLWVMHNEESYLSGSLDSICLCKLHGSVTYFVREDRDSSPGVCSEIARKSADDIYGQSAYVDDYRPHPAVICLGTLDALRGKYGEALVPAIIPPTYAKLAETHWLGETWKAAVEALRRARVLIIIGYSFPSSDGFMRAMMLSAMAEREADDPLYVLLVSPDKDASSRVSDLFRPVVEESRFVWRARRFEDWSASRDPKLASWLRAM